MLANSRPSGIPTGAAVAGSYGSNVSPANYGPGGTLALAQASRAVGGMDYKPALVLNSAHCNYLFVDDDGIERQCMGWPVKNDNPDRLCVGHLKKQAAHGDEPRPDQDVHSDGP